MAVSRALAFMPDRRSSAILVAGASSTTQPMATPLNQTWTGITQKRQFEIEGNKVTVTSAPFKNLAGQDIVFVVTYERIE